MRVKIPDKKRALSIAQSAENDIRYTLSIPITEKSANTIVRNIYESFRMLGEALLIHKGLESPDHVISIDELMKLKVETGRPIYLLQELRKLRHKINYDGYRASLQEAEDAISIAQGCFSPLLKEVLKLLAK